MQVQVVGGSGAGVQGAASAASADDMRLDEDEQVDEDGLREADAAAEAAAAAASVDSVRDAAGIGGLAAPAAVPRAAGGAEGAAGVSCGSAAPGSACDAPCSVTSPPSLRAAAVAAAGTERSEAASCSEMATAFCALGSLRASPHRVSKTRVNEVSGPRAT
jgi:hypothetical protein